MSDSKINPKRCCDLVLKGGVTSGVVYPSAIERIAQDFSLIGIGGTSAGAIAACGAAAAEYRRRHDAGSMRGFKTLSCTVNILAKPGNLPTLFKPDAQTRKLHKLSLDLLESADAGWLKRWRLKARILQRFTFGKGLQPLQANGLGLATGMGNGQPNEAIWRESRARKGQVTPISAWMTELFDEIAGRGSAGRPLTFGDLRTAPPAPCLESNGYSSKYSIDLRAFTTCLSLGRPFSLPFKPVEGRWSYVFAFKQDELRRFFPDRVVNYLLEKGRDIVKGNPQHERFGNWAQRFDQHGLVPLAVDDDMPVVLAARLSLSFPVLFAPIPLYTFEPAQTTIAKQLPPTRVWFSDGGISTNFPVHTFDSLFPRWPTLAIGLQTLDAQGEPGRAGVRNSVYMTGKTGELDDVWKNIAPGLSPIGDLAGLASSIMSSAKDWHDNSFARMPGYSNRVAEVWLSKGEGGLNLKMKPGVVASMQAKGLNAANRLCARFNDSTFKAGRWNDHRWKRFRSSFDSLADALIHFENGAQNPVATDPSLDVLLATETMAPPFNAIYAAAALLELNNFRALVVRLTTAMPADSRGTQLWDGAPEPKIRMGSRPSI